MWTQRGVQTLGALLYCLRPLQHGERILYDHGQRRLHAADADDVMIAQLYHNTMMRVNVIQNSDSNQSNDRVWMMCCCLEHCQLIPDSGSCTATLRRWYYDSETGDCKTFIWGGCDGNDNRFRSRRQCERRCKGTATLTYFFTHSPC